MNKHSKLKGFFKWFFGIIAFIVTFFLILTLVLNFTGPQKYLNDNSNIKIRKYLEFSDGFYIGDISNGLFDGNGYCELNTGSSYNGEWKSSNPDGTGTCIIADCGTYVGSFENGLRSGNGTFTWENGDKYEGEWKNDTAEGKGKITSANGSVFEGSFENNQAVTGYYTATTELGSIKYTIDEKTISQVVLKLNDSTNYTGSFKNGKFEGECTITYANGDRYTGSLSSNLKSGKGTYTWKNGAYYEGAWSNDKMNGDGTYYYTSSSSGKRLNGTFKENSPTGTCTYYDGSKSFTTTWNNGKCTSVK